MNDCCTIPQPSPLFDGEIEWKSWYLGTSNRMTAYRLEDLDDQEFRIPCSQQIRMVHLWSVKSCSSDILTSHMPIASARNFYQIPTVRIFNLKGMKNWMLNNSTCFFAWKEGAFQSPELQSTDAISWTCVEWLGQSFVIRPGNNKVNNVCKYPNYKCNNAILGIKKQLQYSVRPPAMSMTVLFDNRAVYIY